MPTPKSFTNFGGRPIIAGGIVHKKHPLDGLRVINKTGSDIAADKLVAVVGYDTTADLPKVVLADANDATHKAIYVNLATLGNNDTGHVFKGGASAANLDTNSATTVGDPVYLSETAGGFAHTAPTSGDASVVPVGWVKTKSATVGEIDWYVFPAERNGTNTVVDNTETVAATNAIAVSESGKTFFLSSATEFASTLPAPAAGLRFSFVITAAPSGASYTVVTTASAQIIFGKIYSAAGDAGDVENTGGATTITFVDGQSVVGDRVDIVCDGTNYYAVGFASVAAGITFTG
jgi:hypothetical protein